MQPNDDYPPDSPFPQGYETPRPLTPSQRTDSYLPEEFLTFSEPSRQTRRRRGVHQRERSNDSRQEQERRIVKGKWGRRCKTQSCKRRRHPPPPPPPPAASLVQHSQKPIAAHGGTRKTLKNRSKKYKNKQHHKRQTKRVVK